MRWFGLLMFLCAMLNADILGLLTGFLFCLICVFVCLYLLFWGFAVAMGCGLCCVWIARIVMFVCTVTLWVLMF